MPNIISTFTDGRVCFYRRNKKTYYILGWNPTALKWVRTMPELSGLALHRSRVSRDGTVSLNIATSSGAVSRMIRVRSNGYYLKSDDNICIPILESERSLPIGFMLKDYRALDLPCVDTDYSLWLTTPRESIQIKVAKLPKRIAWIIAEDASKNGQSCPISTNDISPLTSSVTTCYHVFDTESINEWIQRNPVNTPCPVCREPCKVTEAYLVGDTT